jgi:hypothetical protein
VVESRESLTIEGRDIEQQQDFMSPTEGSTPTERSTPTELTVQAIVLQIETKLYGSNVPAIAATNAIPLDSGATTTVSQRQCLLPEEADTVALAMGVEAEAEPSLQLSTSS